MAHNIGKMFYVGERPWHGLGKHCPRPLSLDDAVAQAGLDYTVSTMPLAVDGEPGSAVPQRVAVVRDDRRPGQPGRVLGVVHPKFRLLQNRDGAELFDTLFGQGREVYQTGGYLKQGEVVWLQARLPEPIVLASHERVDTYLLFSNSHDGTYPIDIRFCATRVVCNNTLNVALHEKGRGLVFRRGHNHSLERVKAEAKLFYAVVLATQKATHAGFDALARAQCDAEAFSRFLDKLMPLPAKPVSADTRLSVSRAYDTRRMGIEDARKQIAGIYKDGYADLQVQSGWQAPAGESWWGALNAVTGWVDHVQGIAGDRFSHAMFGAGDDLKSKAFVLSKELAGIAG